MKVTIIGLIYKSVQYLDWMVCGIKKYGLCSRNHDIDYIIIANDPSDSVIEALSSGGIPHKIYSDSFPGDFYLNRVYRAHNFGARQASGDVIVFVNSDIGYTPMWIDNLLRELNRNTIPVSRLVESEKMASGKYAVSKNFGRHPSEYKEIEFLKYAESISENCTRDGGLYGPVAFFKDDFISSGGYPEGNIYSGGVGCVDTELIRPSDQHLFYYNPVMKTKKHVTVFDSIVYHIIEGEKDE